MASRSFGDVAFALPFAQVPFLFDVELVTVVAEGAILTVGSPLPALLSNRTWNEWKLDRSEVRLSFPKLPKVSSTLSY